MSFICASCLEPQPPHTKVNEVVKYRKDGSYFMTFKTCTRCLPLMRKVHQSVKAPDHDSMEGSIMGPIIAGHDWEDE